MRHSQPFVFIALAFAACASAVPRVFEADVARPGTHQDSAYHGESLAIEAHLKSGRVPFRVPSGASATMLVSTNGVNWWSWPASVSTDGVVRATWVPAYDCGADSYRIFLGVSESGTNVNYGANMLLRLLGSPGETPNALPLPVQVLDFARISYTNEPWSASSGLSTNDVRKIVETGGVIVTGKVTFAGAGYPLDSSITVEDGRIIRLNDSSLDIVSRNNSLNIIDTDVWLDSWDILYGDYQSLPEYLDSKIAPSTNGLASAEEVAAARMESSLVYQLMMGSNVVAEVTNYNSSVRSPQLRLLQLEEGEYRTVWAETNGLSRTLQEANRHADDAVAELAGRKADRAWGKYTSGLGSDAPSNTTWVSTPVTVIAGGYEYAKVITSAGEAWMLTSNGMAAGPDTNAYFRVATLDGESLFSVERSESVLIGVRAGGITCSGNTVTIPLDVVSAEAPVCYACDDLVSQNWVNLAESLPSWVTSATASGSAGSWVWTIKTTATKGFFQFRALQEGRTVIRNNAPAELSQGIWVNGSRYVPVANGSTLTWTLAQ